MNLQIVMKYFAKLDLLIFPFELHLMKLATDFPNQQSSVLVAMIC